MDFFDLDHFFGLDGGDLLFFLSWGGIELGDEGVKELGVVLFLGFGHIFEGILVRQMFELQFYQQVG